MKKLGISIPNYNRIKKLERLLLELINQILNCELTSTVQICVRDDCSVQDPTDLIGRLMLKYPEIDIKYHRNSVNQGMDENFLGSVLMADSEYSWIIGNDDIPTHDGISMVLDYLNNNKNVDFIVTPFDVHNNQGIVTSTVYPLLNNKNIAYNCSNYDEREQLFLNVRNNAGIFGFLSSVVFRRELWVNSYKDFEEKMRSIFIQVYLNLNAIFNGATYHYLNYKIIKNFADPEMNDTVERMSNILFGLDDVVEFFFKDDVRLHMKNVITDGCINGWIWSLPDDNEIKKKLLKIDSSKNECYKKYYINDENLYDVLGNKKIIIYGAGDFGQRSLQKIIENGLEVTGVVDCSQDKIGKIWNEHKVMSMIDLLALYNSDEYCVIVGSHDYLTEMVENLEKNSIFKIGIVC